MGYAYDVRRVVQCIACLVKAGGRDRLPYMKVLKLLYYADRESLRRAGYPITGDSPYAMRFGPVLSRTYDHVKANPQFPMPDDDAEHWRHYLLTEGYDLRLLADPGDDELSRHDEQILARVWAAHGHEGPFDLSEASHDFPEWRANHRPGTSRPIPVGDILGALDLSEEERSQAEQLMLEDRAYYAAYGDRA